MALKEIKTTLGRTILTYDDATTTLKEVINDAVSRGTDFSYADFYRMDVSGSNFRGANLFSANFREATAMTCNFRETTLNNSNFDEAVASESDFYGASMRMASFFHTKLDRTNFSYADFGHADLLGADFYKSTLCGAAFGDTKNMPYVPTWLPVESFIGWVKVIGEDESYIVKIKILNESQRVRGVGDICRCDKALVLEIQDMEGTKLDIDEIEYHDKWGTLVFKVWEVTECEEWYPGRWNDCKAGITFFIDRHSAVLFE
jgi:hypothetical protein